MRPRPRFNDLVVALWGDAGRHARSAIGAGELPFGMPVEVEAIAVVGGRRGGRQPIAIWLACAAISSMPPSITYEAPVV